MKKNWAKIILIHFHLVDTQNESGKISTEHHTLFYIYFCDSNSIHAHRFKERVSACTTVIQLLMYGVVWKSFHESQLNCGEGERDKISNINSEISVHPPPSLLNHFVGEGVQWHFQIHCRFFAYLHLYCNVLPL